MGDVYAFPSGEKLPPRRTICVDLDGVLAEYNGMNGYDPNVVGKPIEGALEFLAQLAEDYNVVVHTARVSAQHKPGDINAAMMAIYRWFEENNVADNVSLWLGAGKPIASAYVDDRAVLCRPMGSNNKVDAFKLAMMQIKGLCNDE